MNMIVTPDGVLREVLPPIPNTFEEILPLILVMAPDIMEICIDVTGHGIDPENRPYFFAWLDWETAKIEWSRVKTKYGCPQTLSATFKNKEYFNKVWKIWSAYRGHYEIESE